MLDNCHNGQHVWEPPNFNKSPFFLKRIKQNDGNGSNQGIDGRNTINIGNKTPGQTLSSAELREIGYVQYLDYFDQDIEWFQKIKNNILTLSGSGGGPQDPDCAACPF